MLEVLGSNEVVELIGQCDVILYKAISGVLIPGTLQPLPARYDGTASGHNPETVNFVPCAFFNCDTLPFS